MFIGGDQKEQPKTIFRLIHNNATMGFMTGIALEYICVLRLTYVAARLSSVTSRRSPGVRDLASPCCRRDHRSLFGTVIWDSSGSAPFEDTSVLLKSCHYTKLDDVERS